MRFQYILCQKFRYLFVILFSVSLMGTLIAQEKPVNNAAIVSVNLKVVDQNGTPVPSANVVTGNVMISAKTDESGSVLITSYPGTTIVITAPGYEKAAFLMDDVILNNSVKLVKSKLFMTSDDNVQLPYMIIKKRNDPGSDFVVTSDQLEKYPSTDLRNAFVGLVPGLKIMETNGAPGPNAEEKLGVYGITEKVEVSARGRNMMYIIDGVPLGVNEMQIDPMEIESMTVIKDIAGKAIYGPLGADGIINIITKRGQPNHRVFTVNLEDGVSVIDRMPSWVNGADYATLNNQAREANGLNSLYSSAAITAYGQNDPFNMYFPSVNYRDMMLKNTMAFRRANVSASGGNKNVQYSVYAGYNGEGDIYKIGKISDYNRINTRSNLDIKITDKLNLRFDFFAGLTYRRSPNYGYTSTVGEGGSQMDLLEIRSVLPDIQNTPPVAFPVYANNVPALPRPWYAISTAYPNNPIGNLMYNGFYTESGRTGSISAALDWDMSGLIKGLKARLFGNYDALNILRVGKAVNYDAYIVKSNANNDAYTLTRSRAGFDSDALNNLHDYYFQSYTINGILSYDRTFGNHNFQSSLTYNAFRISKNGITEPQRTLSGIWTGLYTFNDKLSILGVLNYSGTYTLASDKRSQLFPSIGVSWIVSDEGFISDLKFINYLKVRAETGIIGIENFMSPYFYRDRWTYNTGTNFGAYSTGQWFGSSTSAPYRTTPSRIGNPDLNWELRKEFSVGIDGLMFNHKLTVQLTYYNNVCEGQITTLPNSMPNFLGISSSLPSINFNNTRYYGLETGLELNTNAGKLRYSIGGNITIQNSKVEKIDEPDWRFAYQKRQGKPADSYWGQTYMGKFQSAEDALVIPQIYDAALSAGDLQYVDLNNDGFIDDNDMSMIGNTTPRLFYALNAQLNYKNFYFTVVGTGCAFFDIPMTNSYFWGGWGDNNYSKFVKDNVGGAYPRLTYYKVNNNFVNSNFWLEKGDFFKIQNVELAYNVPLENLKSIQSHGLRIYVRGSNLLTLTRIKDIDPEGPNAGVTTYPLFRTFTGGIKLTF